MPTSEHRFSIKELTEALLRDQGIHEGYWALNVEFGAVGTSVNAPGDISGTLPGMIVSVKSATLMRAGSAAQGAIDAALANPRKQAEGAKPKSIRTRKPHTTTLQ